MLALNRGTTNTTAVPVTWTELGIDVGKAMDVTNVDRQINRLSRERFITTASPLAAWLTLVSICLARDH